MSKPKVDPKPKAKKVAPVSKVIAGAEKPPVTETKTPEAKAEAPVEAKPARTVTYIMAKGKTCGAKVTKENEDSLDLFLLKPFSRHVKGVKQGTAVGCYR